MNEYEACERAYRNGYAQGLKDRGEKTADEMFRELGYEKHERDDGTTVYMLDSQLKAIIVKECAVYFMWNMLNGWERAPATFPEIRAVCKLLDEMGVE